MSQPSLARRLGTGDAVVVGLAAMLGAGVFVAFAPAAEAPGSGLLVGPWWGFLAGWSFVIGKTASCAAMAMAAAAYAVPADPWAQRVAAALVVVAFTAANLRGVTRTAAIARALLVATIIVLVGFVVLGRALGPTTEPPPLEASGGLVGVLQAAGLLFFAFAGYARIATLAEEVRRPEVLGRAILVALGTAVVLYLMVGMTLISVLGGDLPGSRTPVAAATAAMGATWAEPVVRVGATAASLGALLALLAGVTRTTLAMARERDLPGWLDSVSERHRVPDRAQLLVGGVVVVLVLVADLRGAIGFSSFGVLLYYFVANTAALRQPAAERRWPRALQVLGMAGCLVLAVTLPVWSVVAGVVVLAVGVVGRALTR